MLDSRDYDPKHWTALFSTAAYFAMCSASHARTATHEAHHAMVTRDRCRATAALILARRAKAERIAIHASEIDRVAATLPQWPRKLYVGARVQMHPATDAWMQGNRYGEVVRLYKNGSVRVRLDHGRKRGVVCPVGLEPTLVL